MVEESPLERKFDLVTFCSNLPGRCNHLNGCAKELTDNINYFENSLREIVKKQAPSLEKTRKKVNQQLTRLEKLKTSRNELHRRTRELLTENSNVISELGYNYQVADLAGLVAQFTGILCRFLKKSDKLKDDLESGKKLSTIDLVDLTEFFKEALEIGPTGGHFEIVCWSRLLFLWKETADIWRNRLELLLQSVRWSSIEEEDLDISSTQAIEIEEACIELLKLWTQVSELKKIVAKIPEDLVKWSAPVPLEIFLDPILKRFRFTFFRKSKLNRIDKPVNFLNWIISVVRNRAPLVTNLLTPLYTEVGNSQLDIRADFINSCLEIMEEKLKSDLNRLEELRNSEHQATHDALLLTLVNAVFNFQKELQSIENVGTFQIEPIDSLCKNPWREQWLPLLEAGCRKQMEKLLKTKPWAKIGLKSEKSESLFLVTKLANRFKSLCDGCTDRLRLIRSCKNRAVVLTSTHFVLLDTLVEQLDAEIDKFYDKVQKGTWSPLALFGSINTAETVHKALGIWNEQLIFLELQYVFNKQDELENDITAKQIRLAEDFEVMEESLFDYHRGRLEKLLDRANRAFVGAVQLRFLENGLKDWKRRAPWSEKVRLKDAEGRRGVHPSFAPAREQLAKMLHQMDDGIGKAFGMKIWRAVAERFDDELFAHFIEETRRFTAAGGKQLRADLETLFFIFERAGVKGFVRCRDLITIINMDQTKLDKCLRLFMRGSSVEDDVSTMSRKDKSELQETYNIYFLDFATIGKIASILTSEKSWETSDVASP